MNTGLISFSCFLVVFTITLNSCKRPLPDTELFRVVEVTLKAKNPGSNPYINGPEVNALFTGVSGDAIGKTYRIHGFWDGGNAWKLRFAPTMTGKWQYKTESTDPGLGKKRGSFEAITPSAEHFSSNILYRGFLVPADTFSWKLSDGTPFLPVGETQWSFSEEFTFSEWKEWMNVLSDRHYNTFMGCCWLGKYTRVDLIPFSNRDPASDTLLVDFFRNQLDSMVQYANDKGIMMGLVIGGFPDNSQWFRRFKTLERSDRWFKYIVARYSAYNIRWGLFGELDEARGRNMLEEKTWQWTGNHYAALVKEFDPYKHPVGSHNTRVDFNAAADPKIDFIEVQEGSRVSPYQYKNAMTLRKWNKPLWYEEYWYEMDGDQDAGIRNTYRNFVNAMAFPTMGSLMRNHYGLNPLFPPEEAKKQGIPLYGYLMKNDTGILRMSYFADFYKVLVNDLDEFTPATSLVDKGDCGRFGNNFTVFLVEGGSFTIDLLKETGRFSITSLDIKSGEKRILPDIRGGVKSLINTGLQSDAAILILRSGN
jgi:hypothetical protein